MRASERGEVFVSPFDVIMTNITVVEPDIIYVDDERLRIVSKRGVEGAEPRALPPFPDLLLDPAAIWP